MSHRDHIYRQEDKAGQRKALRRKIHRMDEENLALQKKYEGPEISQPGDKHEQEADTIAKKVVSGDNTSVSQLTSSPLTTQRREEDTPLMAKSESGGLQGTDQLQAKLGSSKGSGQTMDDKTKTEMEGKMNADLGDVRIHTGAKAHEMSEGINAKAFTHGQDIYFKNGNYDPGSNEGKELLVHELVHTQQQKGEVSRQIQRQPGGDDKKTKVDNTRVVTPGLAVKLGELDRMQREKEYQQSITNEAAGFNQRIEEIKKEQAGKKDAPKPQEKPKKQQLLEAWYDDLFSDNASKRYAAIASLDKQGETGWAYLLLASYIDVTHEKWEYEFSEKAKEVVKEGTEFFGEDKRHEYSMALRYTLGTWLDAEKKPMTEGEAARRGFLPFLVQLAEQQNSSLSDHAMALLFSKNLGGAVNLQNYKNSVISELSLAKKKIREVIPAKDNPSFKYFEYFDPQINNEIARLKTEQNAQNIIEAGTRTSELLTYLELAKTIVQYSLQYLQLASVAPEVKTKDKKDKTGEVKVSSIAEAEESGANASTLGTFDTAEAMMYTTYTDAVNLVKTFDPDKRYDYVKARRYLEKRSKKMGGRLNAALIGDMGSLLEDCAQSARDVMAMASYILPGRDAVYELANSYAIKFQGLAMVMPSLQKLSETNPDVFIVFWSEQMAMLSRARAELVVAATVASTGYSWQVVQDSYAKYWGGPQTQLKLNTEQAILKKYHSKLNGLFVGMKSKEPKDIIAELNAITSQKEYQDAMAYMRTQFKELEESYSFWVRIIEGILVALAAIVLTLVTMQPVVAAIGASLLTFLIEGAVFTLYAGVLNSIVFGGDPFANFGEEYAKNLLFLGVFKGLGKAMEGLTEGMGIGGKMLGGVASTIVEIPLITVIDYSWYQLSQWWRDPKEWKEHPYDIDTKLIENAAFVVGVKIGMATVNTTSSLLKLNDPSIEKSREQLERLQKDTDSLLKSLEFRDLTREEWAKMFECSRQSLEVVRENVNSRKKGASKEDLEKIADLNKQIEDMKNLLNGSEMELYKVRASDTVKDVFYFEGDPVAFGKMLTSGDPKASFKADPADPNTYVLRSAKGTKRYIKAGEGDATSVGGEKLGKQLGFEWTDAVKEFWEQAGDPSMAGKAEGSIYVRNAVLEGWRPGKNMKVGEGQLSRAQRMAGREKAEMLKDKFGPDYISIEGIENAYKATRETLERILPSVENADAMRRLLKYFPDLHEVDGVNITPEYVEVKTKGSETKSGETKVRLEKGPLLSDALSLKLKEDISLVEKVNTLFENTLAKDRSDLTTQLETMSADQISAAIDGFKSLGFSDLQVSCLLTGTNIKGVLEGFAGIEVLSNKAVAGDKNIVDGIIDTYKSAGIEIITDANVKVNAVTLANGKTVKIFEWKSPKLDETTLNRDSSTLENRIEVLKNSDNLLGEPADQQAVFDDIRNKSRDKKTETAAGAWGEIIFMERKIFLEKKKVNIPHYDAKKQGESRPDFEILGENAIELKTRTNEELTGKFFNDRIKSINTQFKNSEKGPTIGTAEIQLFDKAAETAQKLPLEELENMVRSGFRKDKNTSVFKVRIYVGNQLYLELTRQVDNTINRTYP